MRGCGRAIRTLKLTNIERKPAPLNPKGAAPASRFVAAVCHPANLDFAGASQQIVLADGIVAKILRDNRVELLPEGAKPVRIGG
jgi:hypothetical protein